MNIFVSELLRGWSHMLSCSASSPPGSARLDGSLIFTLVCHLCSVTLDDSLIFELVCGWFSKGNCALFLSSVSCTMPLRRIFGKISKLFEKFTDIVLSALFLEISFDATKGWIFGQKHLTLSIWQYSVKEVKLVNLSRVNLNIWRVVWTPEAFWVPTFSNISKNQHE